MNDLRYIYDELKKIPIGIHRFGTTLTGFDRTLKPEELKKYKLENTTLYNLIVDYICSDRYKILCERNARYKYENRVKNNPDYKFKLKDGAYGAWSFIDYRYKKNSRNGTVTYDSYLNWLGTQLFDGDFDIKSGNITLDDALEMSKEIIPKLYVRLCKYNWFVCITESTSGKGFHIYTSSIINDVCLRKNDKGYWTYDDSITNDILIHRKMKMFQLNYQIKLFHILNEAKEVWDEMGLEDIQPLQSVFDDAMYKPEQPMNITPIHTGNILINPNFKYEKFDEIEEFIYDDNIESICDIDKYDSKLVEANLDISNEMYEKETDIDNGDIFISVSNKTFKKTPTGNSIENCKGPFYFGHGKRHIQIIDGIPKEIPTIEEMIHTMKCFWNDDEIIDIWKMDNFYNQDAEEAGVLRWIKNYVVVNDQTKTVIDRSKYIPNNYVVQFLNEYCGFNIRYGMYSIPKMKGKYEDIKLGDDEFLGQVFEDIIKNINGEPGIYMIISGTGTGKTQTHLNIHNMKNNIFALFNSKPVLMTEPYNSIIESKLGKDNVKIITGSRQFDNGLNQSTLYATNYIHFDRLDDEKFNNFDYIIIDESHLITKEVFRADQLVHFINKINEISKHCIVLLQTATPMDEQHIFNIKRTFNIIKKDKRNIRYSYHLYDEKKLEDNFRLEYLYNVVEQKLSNGIKTYVYYNNIGLDKAKSFASLFEDKYSVAIYHRGIKDRKEYYGSPMEYIDKHHVMGKYDLLISSVYFGVGNDLDDEIDNACCIIVANSSNKGGNPYQEDVQVFGRFRKANNIDVMSFIMSANNRNVNYNKMLRYKTKNITYNFNDKTNRNKSIVVNGSTYNIENAEDIPLWATISICDEFYSNMAIKNSMLEKYVDDLDTDIHEFEPDMTRIKQVTDFMKGLSNNRLNFKKSAISNIRADKNVEYTGIHKLDRWIRTVKAMYYNIPKNVFDKLLDHICGYSMMHAYSLFNEILYKLKNDELDYGEIAAFEYYRKSEGDISDLIYSYLIWHFYCNYDDNDYVMLENYWINFKWKAKKYREIPVVLIEYLFSVKNIQRERQLTQLRVSNEFFGDNILEDEIIKVMDTVVLDYSPTGKIKSFKNNNKSANEIYSEIIKKENKLDENEINKIGGKLSKRNKSIKINDTFKNVDKYKLKVGQIFLSVNELATYANVSRKTISQWEKKKWIEIVL